jgi:processive 1,2-diacylglycerol beta-glucosyltransferase
MKFLVIHASAGAGHKRAAEALVKACDLALPKNKVSSIDALEFTKPPFKKLYSKAYINLVNNVPEFYGYLYNKLNNRKPSSKITKLRLLFDKINTRKLVRFIYDYNPDAIICTHFLPCELLCEIKKKGKINIPLYVIVTDYETHQFWIYENVDRYYVANRLCAWQLENSNIPKKNIVVSGIPVDPVFSKAKSKRNILTRYGLDKNIFTVLILGGGFGVGRIEELVKSLIKVKKHLQILVVTGHNKKLFKAVKNIETPAHKIKVFGHIDNIDELMHISDVLISKPGGLTVSEAMVKNLPVIIINPIPGQEEANSDYLLQEGAALKLNNLGLIHYIIENILKNPGILTKIKKNLKAIAHPQSAINIVNDISKSLS